MRFFLTIIILFSVFGCRQGKTGYNATIAGLQTDIEKRLTPEELNTVKVPFVVPDSLRREIKKLTRGMRASQKMETIMKFLAYKEHLGLLYCEDSTLFVDELLDSKKGNCIALSHLVLGLARSVNLRASYVYIVRNPTFSIRSHTISVNYHVMVAVEINGNVTKYYDTEPHERTNRFWKLREVTDLQGLALHYNNLGAYALRERDLKKASAFFAISHKLAPGIAEILSNYGLYYIYKEDYATADSVLETAVALDDDSYPAWHNLLYLAKKTKNQTKYNRLTRQLKNKDFPSLNLFFANQAYQQQKYQEALDLLNEINPTSTRLHVVYLFKAQVYAKLEMWDKARKYLKSFETFDQPNTQSLLLRRILEENKSN
jgi:tetratricopeptide (TPR) repeat protein